MLVFCFAGVALHWPNIKGVVVRQPRQLCSTMQVWQRTNLLSVLWNYCYDHLLVDTLAPGESFIDFIAVSERARGKGLGSLLMRWAEQTSVAIMLQRLPDQAGQDLCRILLRVRDIASGSHCSKGSWPLKLTASVNAGCNCISAAQQVTAGGSMPVSWMSH